MARTNSRAGFEVDAIDIFCGFGGSSQGIHAAGATVRAAANHNELALECHAANFPAVDHWQADMVDPNSPEVINRAGKKVPGRYLDPADLPAARFAWFSPGCGDHSQANAKKMYARGRHQASLLGESDFDEVAFARSERSRVTMTCVLRYVAARLPEVLVVENVVDVCHWGPDRDGSTFRWWLAELKKIGYEVEPLFLNSMFFAPCPQSRDRIYIVAWRKGNRRPDLDFRPRAYCTSDACSGRMVDAVASWKHRTASWPLPRWGKYGAQYTYVCPHCHARVHPAAWPALTAIDWSNLGPAIGEREALGQRPLAPATMARIARGLAKFTGSTPMIIPAKGVWGVERPVTWPATTQTSQQEDALVTDGIMLPVAGNTFERPGGCRARSLLDPAFAMHTTPDAWAFAHMPFLANLRGGGSKESAGKLVFDPAATVTGGGLHHGLASPALFAKINGGPGDTAWHHLGEPFNTVTGRDTHGLVVLPWVEQWQADPIGVTEQLAVVMTHLRHSLASIEPGQISDVADADLANVRFRMLDPDPELRAIMAFDPSYILLGNKSQMTAGLGNAVTPPVSSWVTSRCLATLGEAA